MPHRTAAGYEVPVGVEKVNKRGDRVADNENN